MKRWMGYLALVVAVFGIWFGATHRVSGSPQNQAWLVNATRAANVAQSKALSTAVAATTGGVSTGSKQSTGQQSSGQSPAKSSHSTSSGLSGGTAATGQSVQATAGHATAGAVKTPSGQRTTPAEQPAASSKAAVATGTGSVSKTTHPGSASGQSSNPPSPATPGLGTFTIMVTENHGAVQKADKVVPIVKGENLLWYMQKYFTITTIYNGDFIVSIDGIKSQWTGVPVAARKPVDWFLYVNNQAAPVGLADIIPRAGDVDVWDYHSWNPTTGQG